MHGLIEASAASAWNYGGAILTFVFPMVLFLAVAGGLYVIYTKPSLVPGRRHQTVARPVGVTPVPGPPALQRDGGDQPAARQEPGGPPPGRYAPGGAGGAR